MSASSSSSAEPKCYGHCGRVPVPGKGRCEICQAAHNERERVRKANGRKAKASGGDGSPPSITDNSMADNSMASSSSITGTDSMTVREQQDSISEHERVNHREIKEIKTTDVQTGKTTKKVIETKLASETQRDIIRSVKSIELESRMVSQFTQQCDIKYFLDQGNNYEWNVFYQGMARKLYPPPLCRDVKAFFATFDKHQPWNAIDEFLSHPKRYPVVVGTRQHPPMTIFDIGARMFYNDYHPDGSCDFLVDKRLDKPFASLYGQEQDMCTDIHMTLFYQRAMGDILEAAIVQGLELPMKLVPVHTVSIVSCIKRPASSAEEIYAIQAQVPSDPNKMFVLTRMIFADTLDFTQESETSLYCEGYALIKPLVLQHYFSKTNNSEKKREMEANVKQVLDDMKSYSRDTMMEVYRADENVSKALVAMDFHSLCQKRIKTASDRKSSKGSRLQVRLHDMMQSFKNLQKSNPYLDDKVLTMLEDEEAKRAEHNSRIQTPSIDHDLAGLCQVKHEAPVILNGFVVPPNWDAMTTEERAEMQALASGGKKWKASYEMFLEQQQRMEMSMGFGGSVKNQDRGKHLEQLKRSHATIVGSHDAMFGGKRTEKKSKK